MFLCSKIVKYLIVFFLVACVLRIAVYFGLSFQWLEDGIKNFSEVIIDYVEECF